MDEVKAGANWLRSQVETATYLEAWENDHPGDEREVVTYTWNRGAGLKFVNGKRVWTNQVWAVVAVTPGTDTDRPDELAALIDGALDQKFEQYVDDGFWVRQSEEYGILRFVSENFETGAKYRHHGAFYRLKVQKI